MYGWAVVVMNKAHYYNIIVKILQDEETCKKTNENCEKKFSNCLLKEKQDFRTKF